MRRVAFLIDGFNVYHSLDFPKKYRKYKWLDYSELAKCFITKTDKIVGIYYFTAYADWNPEKVKRHDIYIDALKHKGVEVVLGKFKMRDKWCPNCKSWFKTKEEKLTDVNIAIHLFQLAHYDKYDRVFLLSGDSDLIPAIKSVKSTFPAKEVLVIIPLGRKAEELKNEADEYRKLKEKHLLASQFPDEIDLGNDVKLVRPSNWR